MNISLKEANIVGGMVTKTASVLQNISEDDLLKCASIIDKQMLKTAANPSAIMNKLRSGVTNAPATVSASQFLTNRQNVLNEINANRSNWNPLKWLSSVFGHRPSTVARAEDYARRGLGWAQGENLAKTRKSLARKNWWNGGLDQADLNAYNSASSQLGLPGFGGSASNLNRDEFNTLERIVNNTPSSVKNTRQYQDLNRKLQQERQNFAQYRQSRQGEIDTLRNDLQNLRQQQHNDYVRELENRRWYHDPTATAVAGMGATGLGLLGLNAASNIYGGRRDDGGRRAIII